MLVYKFDVLKALIESGYSTHRLRDEELITGQAEKGVHMNEMTDKQMEVILNLVADKFAGCKDMEEVKKAIDEVRNMAKKEKPEG